MGLFSGNKNQVDNDQAPKEPAVKKSDSEWQAQLSPEQFRVLRKQGTERPGTGEYNKFKEEGVYHCAGCNAPLYKSTTKFDSGCGWPAFFDAIPGAVGRNIDRSMFMERIEIVCNNCKQAYFANKALGRGF
ncbi:Peptide methionine sulfoxide reductase B5 [Naganishia onofrii]|uniref:Peptide methionine sulfoxide reductase B5 n=1 Tax=Naganishia onofrii TaxID=1851511 RepID=A0ACC2X484_9TREE|nr:Peptide methionine sulfoxide reductase B5 [Naganishia onofrii]